ncbi:GNAT superfamily N-acetyltransferase [Nocardia sp. GAS34]|uniref:GNAT family N-acetyltransferase n=1 Tax=unclassified Nocardia TaxID=2637762 RepID=UPI003D25361A
MIVRQVGTQDWETVRTARLAALAGSPPGTFATLLEEAQDWDEQHWRDWAARRTMFVAESDAGMIGCVAGTSKGEVPVMVSMFVAAEARGTGTSDLLIEAVTSWARAGGHAELRLWVVEGNTPAEKLYRRLGFVPTGHYRETRVHAPDREYEMTLSLR